MNGLVFLINWKKQKKFDHDYTKVKSLKISFIFPSFLIPFPDTINKIVGKKTLPDWCNQIDGLKDLIRDNKIILLKDSVFCLCYFYNKNQKITVGDSPKSGSGPSQKRFFLFPLNEDEQAEYTKEFVAEISCNSLMYKSI